MIAVLVLQLLLLAWFLWLAARTAHRLLWVAPVESRLFWRGLERALQHGQHAEARRFAEAFGEAWVPLLVRTLLQQGEAPSVDLERADAFEEDPDDAIAERVVAISGELRKIRVAASIAMALGMIGAALGVGELSESIANVGSARFHANDALSIIVSSVVLGAVTSLLAMLALFSLRSAARTLIQALRDAPARLERLVVLESGCL